MSVTDPTVARLTRALRLVLKQARDLADAGDMERLGQRIRLAQALVVELAACLGVDDSPHHGNPNADAQTTIAEFEELLRRLRDKE